MSRARVPEYFDFLLEGFRRGEVSRFVHLGHWDEPPAPGAPPPGAFARAQERLHARLLALAEVGPGQHVLDVGCGFGGTLEALNTTGSGMQLTGLNIDPRQLEICRGIAPQNGNRLAWIAADACHLPFADASFDRVLCIEAMFHFASRRAFFAEAARVLRPSGRLIASDIVLTPDAIHFDSTAIGIAAALSEGFGPWPDVWSVDADHRALGEAAGLACSHWFDATRHTLPSHRFTVPPHLRLGDDRGDATLRAGLALRSLHERALLQYLYLAFDKQ